MHQPYRVASVRLWLPIYSTFTILFQDSQGGLELQDPSTETFLKAEPKDGACILNIGDMLQRFSNGLEYPPTMSIN